jgi:hypothetical protein
MQLTFLCSAHREWVFFHSQTALSQLDNMQEKGETFIEIDNWQEALPFIGCAFETTEILLEVQGAEENFLLGRLTSLSILLANIFNQLGMSKNRQLILDQTEKRLQNVAIRYLGNKQRLSYVQRYIFAIRTCVKKHQFASSQMLKSRKLH